ncbi:MAG: hypothetical protein LBV79_06995 [Candidatus Adiutrix sp.]|jgi:hypothetical protein|nr:hypothetical protein [Candidatus Adiutrix sp.]
MPAQWQLENPLKELDERLENAYKRASGLAGLKLGRDRLNMDALSGSAGQILDINTSGEPFFMRIGRSVGAVAGYRPKDELSLKELAAEVLGEFHGEAAGAFQEARARMFRESSAWLTEHGLDDERRQQLLSAAEEAFLPPSREDMTRAALPYVGQMARPGTWAGFGGLAGFGLMIFTLRHPIFLALGAAAGAGLSYYLARGRTRARAQTLMLKLPQDLYNLLRRDLIANQTRYQEIVNRAAN